MLKTALRSVEDAISSLQAAGHGVAAVLIEGLFSTEGLVKPPAGYVEGLVARVRKAGGLYISDEVQSGFGRTGSSMWGYELFAPTPDIATMGKTMGNGHPIGGAVLGAALLEEFGAANLHFNTFAGNPVSAAAGHAVLNVMADEQLQARAADVGSYMQQQLTNADALASNPHVEGVRGTGLFAGLRFVDPETGEASGPTAKRVVEEMKTKGVLISRVGRHDEVLKIRPPLAFEHKHAENLVSKLLASIERL